MPTKTESNRIDAFDILETIAIFMVTFCHYTLLSHSVPDNFCMTLCFTAVPLFFMVNGALLLHKPFCFRKHLKKILLIYTTGTIWRVIYLIINLLQSGSAERILSLKQETASYLFLWTNSSVAATGHMWFMRSLLAVYLIFPLLHYCFTAGKKGRQILVFLLAVLFVGVFCVTEINVAFMLLEKRFSIRFFTNLDPLLSFLPYAQGNAVFYFLAGALLWDFLNEAEQKPKIGPLLKKRWCIGIMFIFAWFLMIWTKSLTDGTWKWNGVLYLSGYARIPTALASVLLFVLFHNVTIKQKRIRSVIQAVSSSTLGIYYLHWCILPFLLPVFQTSRGVLPNTLKAVAVIVISCGIVFVMRRIPFLRKLVT